MNRKSSALISIGVSVALIAVVIWFLHSLYAAPWGRFGSWHVSHPGWMMGGGGMGIIVLIFWILVIAAAAPLISGAFYNWGSAGRYNSPSLALDILKERYARGEIDKESYEAMKQELQQ